MKTEKIEFTKGVYTAEYIMQNPPPLGKKAKTVWQAAVQEWLRRQNFSFNRKDLKRPIDNIDFAKITRIFNTLLGIRNPPNPETKSESQKKKSSKRRIA